MAHDFKFKFDFEEDVESPFQPGKRVSLSNFRGRHENIRKILRRAKSASKGEVQHYFLTGERGIGKTSLAEFVLKYTEEGLGTTGIFVSNNGKHTIESLISRIISELVKELPADNLKNKAKDTLKNIEKIEFKDTGIKFKTENEESQDIKEVFPFYLNEIIPEINKEKGIFLVIDDINGLGDTYEFAEWYKYFAETIEINKHINLKLYVLIIGYTDKLDKLVEYEPSFGRIFENDELKPLKDEDVKEFYTDTFNSVNITLEDRVLEDFIYYSQGLPLMMQQIGDTAFWKSENNKISKNISLDCVIDATKTIGERQLRSFLNAIKKTEYEYFLMKLGETKSKKFNKLEFKEILEVEYKNKLDDFLKDMKEANVIIEDIKTNNYKFNNLLVYTYFLIYSINK